MTLNATVLKNVTVSFAGKIYTGLLTFVVVALFLPRVLTEEGFGLFAFYNTVFAIASVIVDFGSNTIAVREGSKEPGRLGSLLYSLTLLRLMISVLCFAAVLAVICLFESGREERLLAAGASLHILFHTLGGFNVVFHVRMEFSTMWLATAIGHTLFFVLALVFALGGHSEPFLYLVAFGAGIAISNTVSFLVGRKRIPPFIAGERGETASLFRKAFPLGISALTSIGYFYVDTILLRPLQGEEAVGLYNAAYRLLVFAIMIPVLFNQVLLPVFSRIAGLDRRRFRRIFLRALLYMGVAGVPIAVGLAVLARPVLVLIYPETYARSASCLAVLAAAVALVFLTYPHVSALIAAGRQKTFAWISLAGLLINVVLNLLLIPPYSIEGAAWATVITEAFVLAAAAVSVKRLTGFSMIEPDFLKILPVTAVIGLASYTLRGAPVLATLSVLAALFLICLFVLKLLPFDLNDEDRN